MLTTKQVLFYLFNHDSNSSRQYNRSNAYDKTTQWAYQSMRCSECAQCDYYIKYIIIIICSPNQRTNNGVKKLYIFYFHLLTGTHTAAGIFTLNFQQLRGPFSFQLLPHLMNDPYSLKPAFHMKGTRNYSDIVFGIPTVRRDKENYLMITLLVSKI